MYPRIFALVTLSTQPYKLTSPTKSKECGVFVPRNVVIQVYPRQLGFMTSSVQQYKLASPMKSKGMWSVIPRNVVRKLMKRRERWSEVNHLPSSVLWKWTISFCWVSLCLKKENLLYAKVNLLGCFPCS